MNIHLPAILGFTRYQGFDPSPYFIVIQWDTTEVSRNDMANNVKMDEDGLVQRWGIRHLWPFQCRTWLSTWCFFQRNPRCCMDPYCCLLLLLMSNGPPRKHGTDEGHTEWCKNLGRHSTWLLGRLPFKHFLKRSLAWFGESLGVFSLGLSWSTRC